MLQLLLNTEVWVSVGPNWTHIFGITLLGGALSNGPIEFPQYFVKLFVKLIYQLNSVIRIEGLCFGSVRKKKKKD